MVITSLVGGCSLVQVGSGEGGSRKQTQTVNTWSYIHSVLSVLWIIIIIRTSTLSIIIFFSLIRHNLSHFWKLSIYTKECIIIFFSGIWGRQTKYRPPPSVLSYFLVEYDTIYHKFQSFPFMQNNDRITTFIKTIEASFFSKAFHLYKTMIASNLYQNNDRIQSLSKQWRHHSFDKKAFLTSNLYNKNKFYILIIKTFASLIYIFVIIFPPTTCCTPPVNDPRYTN